MHRRTLCLLPMALLAGCQRAPEDGYRPTLSQAGRSRTVYPVGIHPLHNPQRLLEVYAPIIERINQALPQVTLRLETSRNYEEFERRLYAGHYAFALPNPYHTIRALKKGYRVFGKMADDVNFCGLILVRAGSPIQSVQDLKGQSIAYPAESALAATLLPQQYLQDHGLDVMHDVDNRYVGSQESAMAALLRGHVAAAATWPVPWEALQVNQPRDAALMEVKWRTPTLPNNAWVVRQDVPADDLSRFSQALLALQDSAEGEKLLRAIPLRQFEAADNATYRPVEEFLQRFSRTVRPIDF